jgi:hypothetical protein
MATLSETVITILITLEELTGNTSLNKMAEMVSLGK